MLYILPYIHHCIVVVVDHAYAMLLSEMLMFTHIFEGESFTI